MKAGESNRQRAGIAAHSVRTKLYFLLWIAALLLTLPLKDTRPGGAIEAYNHAWKLFQQGKLFDCQREAEASSRSFSVSDPERASEFQLLQAEAMVWRGSFDEALHLLAARSDFDNPEDRIRKLAIEAVALSHQEQFPAANQKLVQAEKRCKASDYAICGDVIRARGIEAVEEGAPDAARRYFLQSFSFGGVHQNRWLQATAAANLGRTAIMSDHFDEALDWSRIAYRDAEELDAQHIAQIAAGNLGWAYFQLGDDERALQQFLKAEQSAAALGSVSSELNWMGTAGSVYRDMGDLTRASHSYRQAFDLAKQINSKVDIGYALEDLAQVSVDSGKLDEAASFIAEVTPMELANGGRLSPNLLLTQGMLAAARHQDTQAHSLFEKVQNDPASLTTTRLNAGYQLAALYESQGNIPAAEGMYKSTLAIFDSAQAELKSEESKLPYAANAARIYDDYIQLLVREGKGDEALEVADQSRARTLTQALGVSPGTASLRKTAIDPRHIAQRAGATLLFYWLGRKQSYLWAITPAHVTLFPLLAQQQIRARIDRYSKAINDLENPLQSQNQDGQSLYQTLVAPASSVLRPNTPVIVLADGALDQLNFETLLAPGHASGSGSPGPDLHYWIDDATVLSAPSLAMLGAAKPTFNSDRSLLLLGNPVSASDNFPSLPLFGFEMTRIEKHFNPQHVSAFAGAQATPAAYLASSPSRYSYIHFVSHAVASRTDPLDSAIILSNSTASAGSFKLYARDIMQHPIDAQLVTISACDGIGTRAYAGEGLVGLSWAFMRAGAHSVIGALWEVSDDSTPRLMDSLYEGLEHGESAAASLRHAKLNLLHTGSKFVAPFYWAPFQIYTTR